MNQRLKRACLYALPVLIVIVHSNFFYTRLTAAPSNDVKESSTITVYNLGNAPVYVATYCKNLITSSSKRTSAVKVISPNGSVELPILSISVRCARNISFSQQPNELPESLSKAGLAKVGSVGIGTTSGGILSSSFYIIRIDNKLNGYSALEFNAKNILLKMSAIAQTFFDTELQLAKQKSLNSKRDPHAFETAKIRFGAEIPEQEAAFVKTRKEKNKTALEKLLGRRLNGTYIPTIAFVNSGGGTRALISALGMHVGAEKTGLLDCITYDVGLSGGSWFVGLWQQSQLAPSLFKNRMQPIIARGMNPARPADFGLTDVQNVLSGIMTRKAAEQPTTLVTLWGSMLANRYLSPYAPYSQDVLFSELTNSMSDARMPFPLLAAVNGRFADLGVDLEKAEWFEFSPVEASGVGNWLGDASVPMWSLGRIFANNQSIDTKPEYDFGQLMGICGSAFAATIGRIFAEAPYINMASHFIISKTIGEELAANKRFSVGKIPNYTRNISGSLISQFDDLRLVDAGMSFNIPVPLVLHPKRKADIIIVMDASGGEIGEALKLAENYAHLHSLPFPAISYEHIKTRALNVYESPDANAPTIIHLSRAVDRDSVQYPSFVHKDYSTKISTGQFQYTAEEFNRLSGVTEANLVHNIEAIKQAIAQKIQLHNGFVN